jgi:hypothetical protein
MSLRKVWDLSCDTSMISCYRQDVLDCPLTDMWLDLVSDLGKRFTTSLLGFSNDLSSCVICDLWWTAGTRLVFSGTSFFVLLPDPECSVILNICDATLCGVLNSA